MEGCLFWRIYKTMKILKKKKGKHFFIFLFMMFTPFSYLTLFNIRIIIIQVILALCILTTYVLIKKSITFNISFLFLLFLLFISFIYGYITNNFNEMFSLFVFFILFFSLSQIERNYYNSLIIYYKYGIIFTAFGLLLQVVLF